MCSRADRRCRIEPDRLLEVFVRASRAIAAHMVELTELDRAIGDGDHGLNMKRGFDALDAAAGRICRLPLPRALHEAGTTLVLHIGGAAGPLYGSLLMGMSTAAHTRDLTAMLHDGVDAVMRRGRSTAGEKTMLDVLVPVLEAIRSTKRGRIEAARAAADRGLARTRPMLATKGRASFLGPRSIGHLDPGARSSALLVHTVCDVLERRP